MALLVFVIIFKMYCYISARY